MEKAKRARKAETLKQPSLCLRLRAPYLYPDHYLVAGQAQFYEELNRYYVGCEDVNERSRQLSRAPPCCSGPRRPRPSGVAT
jgi:hypothetical protein